MATTAAPGSTNHAGDAVNPRSQERVAAENEWLAFGAAHGVPVQVFRLAGIYGPGQNQLVQLARGTARRIVKPGQVFNRIHVEDIARVLDASLEKPRAGAIYNVADDEPAPAPDAMAFAARLCGVTPPRRSRWRTPGCRRWRCRSTRNASARGTGCCTTSSASRWPIRPTARG